MKLLENYNCSLRFKYDSEIGSVSCWDTNRLCVYLQWIESIFSGDKRLKLKRISEGFVRARLGMIQQIVSE